MLAHLVANHSPSLSSIASANCSSAALRACRSTSDSMPTEPLSKIRFSILELYSRAYSKANRAPMEYPMRE